MRQESDDREENSTNVLNNSRNNINGTKDKILPSKPQNPKRIKRDEENKNETGMLAATSNDDQSPDIYKLPVELLVDTFDYLPMEDLCAIRQTSKWFSQVAGFCFQKNYSAMQTSIRPRDSIEYKVFYSLIQEVGIHMEEHLRMQEYYANGGSQFQRVKRIRFAVVDFADVKLEYIKEIVGNIECPELVCCKIVNSLAGRIHSIFPNLKHLKLLVSNLLDCGSEWIACKYPKLERFELHAPFDGLTIGPLLEMNPNICKLALDAKSFWNNRESMKLIKLDDLAIDIRCPKNGSCSESFCHFLNELHELRSYKRLKVYISLHPIDKDQIIELSSLHKLVKLCVCQMSTKFDSKTEELYADRFALSMFRNLEEIYIPFSCGINEIEATADNLKNLERIRFEYADLNDVIVFIEKSKNLTKIKVDFFVLLCPFMKKTKEKIIYKQLNNRFIAEADFKRQKVINL